MANGRLVTVCLAASYLYRARPSSFSWLQQQHNLVIADRALGTCNQRCGIFALRLEFGSPILRPSLLTCVLYTASSSHARWPPSCSQMSKSCRVMNMLHAVQWNGLHNHRSILQPDSVVPSRCSLLCNSALLRACLKSTATYMTSTCICKKQFIFAALMGTGVPSLLNNASRTVDTP